MPCGPDAELDVLDHWCEPLDLRKEPAGWRGWCPRGCKSERKQLSVWIQGGHIRWRCWCQCSREDVEKEICRLVPCYRPSRRQRSVSAEQVAAIVTSDMQAQAKHLALLEAAGYGTRQALDMLGVRREHRSRLITRRQLLPHPVGCITAGQLPHPVG